MVSTGQPVLWASDPIRSSPAREFVNDAMRVFALILQPLQILAWAGTEREGGIGHGERASRRTSLAPTLVGHACDRQPARGGRRILLLRASGGAVRLGRDRPLD